MQGAAKPARELCDKKTGERRETQTVYYVTRLCPQNAGPQQLLELARG